MTATSQPQLVTLRSGDVVQIRPVRPDDAPALVRAYANLGEQSRYRRFFTVMPELPEAILKTAVEVDHVDHEALVAAPLRSAEIVGECRYIRLPDQPDTAEVGVTESHGPVVTARVELAEPPRQTHPDLLDLLTAAARGDILTLPVLLRRLIRVPEGLTHIVRLPVSAALKTLRPGPRTPDAPDGHN